MLPHESIEQRLQEAVRTVVPDADPSKVLVRPCVDPKFGDYQANALMSLAKARKLNPRQLATDVLSKLNVADLCDNAQIAGAGFLNFRLAGFCGWLRLLLGFHFSILPARRFRA